MQMDLPFPFCCTLHHNCKIRPTNNLVVGNKVLEKTGRVGQAFGIPSTLQNASELAGRSALPRVDPLISYQFVLLCILLEREPFASP